MLVGHLDRENATQAVLAIRNAGSGYEDVLFRDLFLAAKCLTDDPEVEPGPAEWVVEELMEVVATWQPDQRALNAARCLARLVGLTRWQAMIGGWLPSRIAEFQPESVVEMLTGLSGLPNPTGPLITAVADLLSHRSWWVRRAATAFITQQSLDRPDILEMIDAKLTSELHGVRTFRYWVLHKERH